ncbi:MAG: molybdopterin-dependent oxidoreductase [Rubripirellula sp.]
MMTPETLEIHRRRTRRFFMQCGVAGIIAMESHPLLGQSSVSNQTLDEAIDGIESWLTRQDEFRDISRGNPLPHELPEAEKKEVGLSRETWKLEIVSDEDDPSRLRNPLTKETGTALDFNQLVELGKTHAVRFPKVMSCLNIGCPLGMGIWEGVPLRKLVWMTQPVNNLRRVFYDGYHNEDPSQLFRSSLSVNRILEDPTDLPPVIVCYKLNGQWLTSERGGPVRMVVPEAYGFKSIKWLNRIVLSNISHANDTYAKQNNDLDSPIKTFCNLFPTGTSYAANTPIALTGWAQVGRAGLDKVQVWIHPNNAALPEEDKYFKTAPWRDAKILGPPKAWGGDLPDGKIVIPTKGFGASGAPEQWPLRLTKAHWATLHPGLKPGKYTIRCRTVDKNQHAQPMPRPFRKSGHAAIQAVNIVVS